MLILALLACDPDPSTPVPGEPVVLADRVEADALLDHLDALEGLADANGATRAHLSFGYLDSADYIEETLSAAGYAVEREAFEIVSWDVDAAAFQDDAGLAFVDWDVFSYSASGDVTGPVEPVDVVLPPGPENSSTSGCETADFAGFTPGAIALVQRGSCTFSEKAANAEAAGAVAVLVFNEGQPDRQDVVAGTLDSASPPGIPVLGLSFALGEALVGQAGTPVRVLVDAGFIESESENLFVEIPGAEDGVVMLGAHLDSVPAGPGINDNGSGSAFLLEVALQARESGWQPAHPVRFAWWGAEEIGLLGSRAWVYDPKTGEPDQARLDALDAYLNFDMMGSSNGARFVYDGDNSDIADGGGSQASGAIEAVYLDWFESEGLEPEPEGMFVPSDSWWFVLEGVPTGGVFSGAFLEKPTGLVQAQGGTAGVAYDVCYHEPCDRLDQIDPVLYDELARASAHVVQTLAEREGPATQARRIRRPTADRLVTPRPSGCHDHARWDR